MLRNKYKYCKNHGLLPNLPNKPRKSPITSIAILAPTDTQRQYTLTTHPSNPSMLMMFNQRQYLHKQCSLLLNAQSANVGQQVLNELPNINLTVYIANDYQSCQKNITGAEQIQKGLLWQIYQDMVERKQEGTSIVMSVTGVESENQLVDLLVVDRPEEMEYLPCYLKQVPFLKRKIRVSKAPEGHKYFAQNNLIETVQSVEDLKASLGRFKTIKNQLQTFKLMTQSTPSAGNWLQGQLIQLSQVRYDTDCNRITHQLRTHYILRVNQYLKSTAGLMLKLGMNLRHMQQRHSNSYCDNSESKLFKLLSGCFQKRNKERQCHITVIYEVGRYKTIKDEYTNLVPTCELISDRQQLKNGKIEGISFLYLKHYHDYAQLVTLLSKMQSEFKQTKNIQQYLEQSTEAYKTAKMALTNYRKSYICDTISSIEKKVQKNFIQAQEEEIGELEMFVKKTAKMYGQEGKRSRQKSENRSGFKKSEKIDQRMSLFQWGSRPKAKTKIYASKSLVGRMSQADRTRQSAQFPRATNSTWARAKTNNSYLNTIYGIKPRRNPQLQSITSQKSQKKNRQPYEGHQTKGLVDNMVKRQILQLGREQDIYNDDSSEVEVIM